MRSCHSLSTAGRTANAALVSLAHFTLLALTSEALTACSGDKVFSSTSSTDPDDGGCHAEIDSGSEGGNSPVLQDAQPPSQEALDCGDGLLDLGEQCDDGNTDAFDGCDGECRQEVFFRLNDFAIATEPAPSFCELGAFNTAFGSIALPTINARLSAGASLGASVPLMQLIGLDDLSGRDDAEVELGSARGIAGSEGLVPMQRDQIVTIVQSTHGGGGRPTRMAGKLQGGTLEVGPGNMLLPLDFAGNDFTLRLFDARLRARLDVPSVPSQHPSGFQATESSPEYLVTTGLGDGLCGAISVESLSKIPVMNELAEGVGSVTCEETYVACEPGAVAGEDCSSLLDALIAGCNAGGFGAVVAATQPDVPGDGPPELSIDPATGHVPLSQIEGNTHGYSAFFLLKGERVLVDGAIDR